MNKIKNFFADETGLELSEYAIAAALVAAGIGILFTNLGSKITNAITRLVTNVS